MVWIYFLLIKYGHPTDESHCFKATSFKNLNLGNFQEFVEKNIKNIYEGLSQNLVKF